MTGDAEIAEPQVPTVPLPAETLVMDTKTGRQLIRADGFMLPAGRLDDFVWDSNSLV